MTKIVSGLLFVAATLVVCYLIGLLVPKGMRGGDPPLQTGLIVLLSISVIGGAAWWLSK